MGNGYGDDVNIVNDYTDNHNTDNNGESDNDYKDDDDDLLAMDELYLMTDNRQLWKGCQAGSVEFQNLQKCEQLSHTKTFQQKTNLY